MAIFSRSKSLGREAAQRLIAGHTTLMAYWALRHAGVLDAMIATPDGLDPARHAARTSMSPQVLTALLTYLATNGIVEFKGDIVRLTATGRALRDHEDGTLELLRAYGPVLASVEHLLARLRTYGNGLSRRADSLLESQVARYGEEVYPTLQRAVLAAKTTHLLDLNSGSGEFLLRLAKATRNLAGVGVCPDGPAVRRANDAITTAGLEKRLIAVVGSGVEVCSDTRDAFERLGISTAFWEKVDCVVACNVFADLAGRDATSAIAALARIPRVFPNATFILAEPTLVPGKSHYAAELDLLLSLSNHPLLPPAQWRDMLSTAGLLVTHHAALTTDSLHVFTCHPARRAIKPDAAARNDTPAPSIAQ